MVPYSLESLCSFIVVLRQDKIPWTAIAIMRLISEATLWGCFFDGQTVFVQCVLLGSHMHFFRAPLLKRLRSYFGIFTRASYEVDGVFFWPFRILVRWERIFWETKILKARVFIQHSYRIAGKLHVNWVMARFIELWVDIRFVILIYCNSVPKQMKNAIRLRQSLQITRITIEGW